MVSRAARVLLIGKNGKFGKFGDLRDFLRLLGPVSAVVEVEFRVFGEVVVRFPSRVSDDRVFPNRRYGVLMGKTGNSGKPPEIRGLEPGFARGGCERVPGLD